MARVLVIGGGIAGLWTAVKAADAGHEVEVVTKTALGEGSTRHAQGGIAAALFPDDSADRHAADTLEAGAGLADPEAVRVLCAEGPARVRDLIRFGVAFDGGESGLARGLEAAHSRARILHAGGDATGAAIEQALVATVRRRAVRITEHAMLVDLIVDRDDDTDRSGNGIDADRTAEGRQGSGLAGGRVVGATVLEASGELIERRADTVVLATGGSGCLYRHTTNPAVATGDGVAAAWRAGAIVADLEFTQFHPTALAAPGTPLISEAVRGEGAVLRDALGERFMLEIDPRGELAPRDVVARAVWRRMREQGGAPVLLDATALDTAGLQPTGGNPPGAGTGWLAQRFPGIDRVLRDAGYEWSREPVPVTPAAHYAMGGIATDLDARTSLPGLLAVGECARTGVHGANRLASNSLLEAAVFADRAVRSISDPGSASRVVGTNPRHAARTRVTPGVASDAADDSRRDQAPAYTRRRLQELMWSRVGLERDEAGLAEASALLDAWHTPEPVDRASAEDRNLLDLARLTVAAARARRVSVGAHFRADADDALDAERPATAPNLNRALEAA
jgi:L-aspartate oxidase